jgi:homoserine dehydrogenase
MPTDLTILRIGLAGLGNVGAGVYKNIEKNRDLHIERTGSDLRVVKIAVRDLTKKRDVEVPAEICTTRWQDLVEDKSLDIIVELIGGVDEAYDLVKAALNAGKAVVTGNKALLALHGKELVALAEEKNVPLYIEAAVAGGIPIIKAVKEALVGNRIEAIYGIINGTSNYILTRMTQAGLSFEDALGEASALGYAEADPSLDINGWDAGHKAIILAWLSYGHWLPMKDVSVTGIENISLTDVAFARQLGYDIKLLAVIRQDDEGLIEVRVQTALVPKEHILASVSGVFNAVSVRGDVVGETLFYGSGAGQDATSSSVIADLSDAAENLANGVGCNGFVPHGDVGRAKPLADTISQYYLRLTVTDKPGTLAKIATLLGARDIGILSVIQPETGPDADAQLVMTIHDAAYGNMRAAVEEICALDCTKESPVLLRIETLV